jgi:hypothetical protein
MLTRSPYAVKSGVSVETFHEFVRALKGEAIKITKDNFRGLTQLCCEFGFGALALQLSRFRESDRLTEAATTENTEARISISMTEINHCGALFGGGFTLRAKDSTFECSVGQAVALSPAVREQLSVDACARTFAFTDVSALDSIRGLLSGCAVPPVVSQSGFGLQLCNPGLELAGADRLDMNSVDLSMFSVEALNEILGGTSFSIASEDDLLKQLLNLGEEYRPLLMWIEIGFLSAAGLAALAEQLEFATESAWCGIADYLNPPRWLNSVIISDFPAILAEFGRKRFSLLWRGSRDGFGARNFHNRCDGHANTLTIILDTNGNIFGGFTPVEWESRTIKCYRPDPSRKTFIFTLKNHHNIPARRFRMNDTAEGPVFCEPRNGPNFCLIGVYDQCNESNKNYAKFFESNIDKFNNDTGLDGDEVFVPSGHFRVKEIEVFQIED